MTNDSGVRAIIYVLEANHDFAVFDRDVSGMEAQHLGSWSEFTPVGLVVAKDAVLFAQTASDDHMLLLPTGERLNARQVLSDDGIGRGVTVIKLPPLGSA